VGRTEVGLHYTWEQGLHAERYRVDVLVHHRHLRPLPPDAVQVMLLARRLFTNEGDGATLPIDPAWKAAVVGSLGPTPPRLPIFWRLVGIGRPDQPVDARMPRSVDFDLDLTNELTGRFVLVGVVSSATDPLTVAELPGTTLRGVVLASHHVAARGIEIR
jgi:hypothetical protein